MGYLTLEPIDMLLRDGSGGAGGTTLRNDQYAWYVGAEGGLLVPFGRVGVYARYDLVRGLLWLLDMGAGDAAAQTFDYGLAAALGQGRLRLEARWGWYQWSHEDSVQGGRNRVEGQQLTFSAHLGF